MEAIKPHTCVPLSVAGVLRCVAPVHWWEPVQRVQAPARHLKAVSK